MKIVKQIDDTHFEVEMEKYDKDDMIRLSLVHDYVAISSPNYFCTNLKIDGEYNVGASNTLQYNSFIQIPIRAAQKILELLKGDIIKGTEYLKPGHLLCEDRSLNYLRSNRPIVFKDKNGKQCVAVREDDKEEYTVIPLSLYLHIKGESV